MSKRDLKTEGKERTRRLEWTLTSREGVEAKCVGPEAPRQPAFA